MNPGKSLKGKVQTVLGPIEPEDLGPTLIHEHILCDLTPPGLSAPDGGETEITLENVWEIRYHWNKHPGNCRLDDYGVAVKELRRTKADGGGAVVDQTSRGMKRDPSGLRKVSEQAGVHIIMVCGYYVEESWPREGGTGSSDAMAEAMISEFCDGAEGTGVCAGLIGEIGCSHPWTDSEKRVMEAAVKAQRSTGASISVHPGRDPEAPFEIIRFVESRGGDPGRTIMGHLDRTLFDVDALTRLARTGCMLEWDFFGIESSYYPFQDIDLPNDGTRLSLIRALMERGFSERILISQDICTKTRLVTYGGHGYGHIFRNVVPIMRRRGFRDPEIRTLLWENPRRLLTLV
jgi:phosphotriesterase-related protein